MATLPPPAVMISEAPLPMPYLSICSASHIRNAVPAVIEVTAITHHSGLFDQLG